MGRPLKIAKAQVLTWTESNGTTDVATVAENLYNLNIIAGMPFVLTTTTAGLTAGVTYWFLQILTANTFIVGSGPNGPKQNIIFSGPVTVPMSVGAVDTGFNNPNSASYGVVGGNTGIYGNQILANVCIAVAGQGTISSVAANTQVYGTLTDFANTAPVTAAIEVPGVGTLGFVSAVAAAVAVTDTVATGNLVTVASSTTFVLNKPVTLAANIGGLVAGTVYYVKSKPDAGNISVSLTPGGANVVVSDETVSTTILQDVITLAAGSGFTVSNATWTHADQEPGFILRQKGRNKFLVQGATSGLVGACYTANVANTALTGGFMNVVATTAAPADFYVDRIADHQVHSFGANTDVQEQFVATFGTAYAANTYGGQPDAIVTISKA